MPELPEVEVVRAGLAPAVTGATITGVDVLDERALTRHDRTVGAFESLATGARIDAAVRRGKFLWLPIGAERAIVGHLGMSGQILLRTPDHAGDDRADRNNAFAACRVKQTSPNRCFDDRAAQRRGEHARHAPRT